MILAPYFQMLFEQFGVPALYMTPSTLLTVYSCGRVSAMAVDCGDGTIQSLPIYEGHTMRSAITRMDLGGSDLTDYLGKLLLRRGCSFSTTSERQIVRDIKETLCYVATDYEQQLTAKSLGKEYKLPDGQTVTISEERVRCAEALFKPHLLGRTCPGLHEFTYQALMNCDIDTRKDLYPNIILSGGCSMFPGLQKRMQDEITSLLPSPMKVRVIAPPERAYAAWIGGSILASLSTFQDWWVSKQQYEDYGPTVVHRMFLQSSRQD